MRSDATHVVFVSGNFDITSVSPSSAPAVFHQPIFFPIVNSISNSQDCMINFLFSALMVVVNSIFIELKVSEVSLDTNSNWTLSGNGTLEGILIIASNINKIKNFCSNIIFVKVTFLDPGMIWITTLCIYSTLVLNILKSFVNLLLPDFGSTQNGLPAAKLLRFS